MTVQELADRESIRQLMANYNIHGDRGKLELLVETFCEDGILILPFKEMQGRSGILAGLREIKPEHTLFSFVRHHLTTSQIEFTSADIARGRSYFMVLTDMGLDHAGTYFDTFRREGGEWRIAQRSVRLDYVGQQTLFLKEFYAMQPRQGNR